MDNEERIKNALRRACKCEEDEAALAKTAELIRPYAYFGDEHFDAAEDPQMIAAIKALDIARRKIIEAAQSIKQQAEKMPGYAEMCKKEDAEVAAALSGWPRDD